MSSTHIEKHDGGTAYTEDDGKIMDNASGRQVLFP